jgi:hypothetical protein
MGIRFIHGSIRIDLTENHPVHDRELELYSHSTSEGCAGVDKNIRKRVFASTLDSFGLIHGLYTRFFGSSTCVLLFIMKLSIQLEEVPLLEIHTSICLLETKTNQLECVLS